MSFPKNLTSVGKKILMGLTGLALIGFLCAHLAGNLLVFIGPGTFNEYSHKLTANPLIYVAELGLLAIFLGHLATGIALTLRNRAARPTPYHVKRSAGHTTRKSLASATMIVSGAIVLVFVPLHLWTFKFGKSYGAEGGVRDLYRLVMEVFSSPGYVLWYLVAMVFVGFHLWHGFSSAFQSLGAEHPRWDPLLRSFGWFLSVLIAGGFIAVPVVIFFAGGKL
ncbi:MAG: succinate dehydrogenase cytochrome b subunit [Candidatus Schekmanbacteria bacterium]|nr:succinate dehydrogenase cytochrome b subunit [Candidatus Schekmanbacteria bacterium]